MLGRKPAFAGEVPIARQVTKLSQRTGLQAECSLPSSHILMDYPLEIMCKCLDLRAQWHPFLVDVIDAYFHFIGLN